MVWQMQRKANNGSDGNDGESEHPILCEKLVLGAQMARFAKQTHTGEAA